MCTNKRKIFSKYAGKSFYVKCGKCAACQQERANRNVSRINNEWQPGKVCIFFGLTYDEKFIPYVTKSDLENPLLDEIPIYRDYDVRFYKERCREYIVTEPVAYSSFPTYDDGDFKFRNVQFFQNLYKKHRGFHREKMGVALYKDLQNFFKRLRQYVSRRYGDCQFSYFAVSEYGDKHKRPHFHVLLYCRAEDERFFRNGILHCWPYEDRNQLEEHIELARNAASYVASYVNNRFDIPSVLANLFPPKKSFSRSFGFNPRIFSLSKVLEYTDRNSLLYDRKITENGVSRVVALPLPKYVVNRYFPLFKGFSRIGYDKIYSVLSFPENYIGLHAAESLTSYKDGLQPDGSFSNDTRKYLVRLKNAQNKYCSLTGKNRYDFAIDYLRVWSCFKNTMFRYLFLSDNSAPLYECFDNIGEFKEGCVTSLSLDPAKVIYTNCNEFPSVLAHDAELEERFFRTKHHRQVNNFVYSSINSNF